MDLKPGVNDLTRDAIGCLGEFRQLAQIAHGSIRLGDLGVLGGSIFFLQCGNNLLGGTYSRRVGFEWFQSASSARTAAMKASGWSSIT
jgi:hypothetical protein